MSDAKDLRLIEDYLPIEAISAEASREKSVRKGHISTLHLWWARRPLVACRAAVYGALVPADRWVKKVTLKNPPDDPDKAERVRNGKKLGLNRKAAAEFVTRLCKYPGEPRVIAEAQKHILEAHAERLTAELAEAQQTGNMPAWVEEFQWPRDKTNVTCDDILAGRAPRPRVLDMFAGGGAIPLEALRLGCEAYALDLNPVAHIIELCTLVYPQKYGQPDPTVPGMTGPPLECGGSTPLSHAVQPLPDRSKERGSAAIQSGVEPPHSKRSWGGLAAEVRYWGQWVLEKVKAEIGDLYPPIPDPDAPLGRERMRKRQTEFATEGFEQRGQMEFAKDLPGGYLTPVAYLWTRTVTCKNPNCRATVPLVKQTWLCKKKDRYVALRIVPARAGKRVRFHLVESKTEKDLGFDPAAFSKGGNATCPFCGTVADSNYVKKEGKANRIGTQAMGVVCVRRGARGKVYFAADDIADDLMADGAICEQRLAELCNRTGLTVPDEPITNDGKNANFCMLYGLDRFSKLFTPRQMLSLLTFVVAVREAHRMMAIDCSERAMAVATMLACIVDKLADFNSTLCVLKADGGRGIVHTFGRQALPMIWDFAEANPFNEDIASWASSEAEVFNNIQYLAGERPAVVTRGSATGLPWADGSLHAIITDPPYYDNVPYADIADFFYVWLKRTVGHLYTEHFSSQATPKKQEAVADATRHGGNKRTAVRAYEEMMAQSLTEAHRVLAQDGTLAIVYAHKTTVGWCTLVDAFRRAGFMVSEAWPLATETSGRLRAQESAALASSIFLVGRKRWNRETAPYESIVRPELEAIVRERVATLWDQGISGADLVIACVGAGLRAFTRFARVEYANGDEVPAERFLSEVETVVLETILARLSKEVGGNGGKQSLAALDPASRFYVLWRYTYKAADLDAGEAIVFANGTHVELDGPAGLSAGAGAILQKKKGKYRLRDFTERSDDPDLGMLSKDGQPAPVIDALHRTLWLMENRPAELPRFLREAQPNREQMRLLAQALAGPGLKGGELADVSPSAEQAALAKLTANWRSVVEDAVTTAAERSDQKRGQRRMFES